MAKKKVIEEVYSGTFTWEMLALWTLASLPDNYDLRVQLATLQFYFKSSLKDGLHVIGTKSLAVTQQMAEKYFGK
ncbi:MAG: hypothetical protein II399_10500 [Lachnospiraceae bacterium]|nr:hypothetical protein [Lachnospiraceae bacterium]